MAITLPARWGAFAAALLTGAALAAAAPAPASAAACPSWSTAGKSAGNDATVGTRVRDVRAGEHACFDRLVIDMGAGTAAHWRVAYAAHIYREGSGFEMFPRGRAKLRIVVLSPAANVYPASADELVDVTGFAVFRQAMGGGSFEAHTLIALGVSRWPSGTKRGFRVFYATDAAGHRDIVIDVRR